MSTVLEMAKKLNKEFNDENLAITADLQPKYTKMGLDCLGFDLPLGGGIPYGNIITMAGPFASGKTTLASSLIKKYQDDNPDKTCIFIDVERGFNAEFQASITGLDLSKLLYIVPSGLSAEQILDMITDFQQTDNVGAIFLDSIPALIPGEVMETGFERDLGLRATVAKKLYPFMARMADLVKQKGNIFCCISQVRSKPVMGSPVPAIEISGGDALKYYSSLILRFAKRTWTKGDKVDLTKSDDCDGFRVRFSVYKSRIADVRKANGFITYRYGKGIDYDFDNLEVALTYNLIERSGAYYTLKNLNTGDYYLDESGNPLKFRGEAAVREYFKNNPDFMKEYLDSVVKFKCAPTKEISEIKLLDDPELEEHTIDLEE